jgi:hypothetical protein
MNDSIAGDVERIISGAGSAEADCAVITLGEALDAWRRADAWRDPVAYTQLVDRLDGVGSVLTSTPDRRGRPFA